jgi:hypothetical protein
MNTKEMSKDEIFAEADRNEKNEALDKAFGAVEQEAIPETKKEVSEEAPAESMVNIKELLAGIKGSPKPEMIDNWKRLHGDVYILPLDEKEMYIWRPLKKIEYDTILNGEMAKNDNSFREAVVLKALLWPKLMPEQVAATRAGLMDTLFQVIMQGSYFLTPEFALSLVQKL